ALVRIVEGICSRYPSLQPILHTVTTNWSFERLVYNSKGRSRQEWQAVDRYATGGDPLNPFEYDENTYFRIIDKGPLYNTFYRFDRGKEQYVDATEAQPYVDVHYRDEVSDYHQDWFSLNNYGHTKFNNAFKVTCEWSGAYETFEFVLRGVDLSTPYTYDIYYNFQAEAGMTWEKWVASDFNKSASKGLTLWIDTEGYVRMGNKQSYLYPNYSLIPQSGGEYLPDKANAIKKTDEVSSQYQYGYAYKRTAVQFEIRLFNDDTGTSYETIYLDAEPELSELNAQDGHTWLTWKDSTYNESMYRGIKLTIENGQPVAVQRLGREWDPDTHEQLPIGTPVNLHYQSHTGDNVGADTLIIRPTTSPEDRVWYGAVCPSPYINMTIRYTEDGGQSVSYAWSDLEKGMDFEQFINSSYYNNLINYYDITLTVDSSDHIIMSRRGKSGTLLTGEGGSPVMKYDVIEESYSMEYFASLE
ncbi:MAG: hypothetical protein HUJ56_02075, partial [Erysipelotrichaceae bacterium]|nr:hypothetical protein [Erysipelotrichaceae bacterium]